MTREQAIERVRKLQAVTVQRGATEHEAAAAASCAARLATRFGLRHPPPRRQPATHRYATAAGADRRSPRSRRFVGFA